jgi:hypothetical protein
MKLVLDTQKFLELMLYFISCKCVIRDESEMRSVLLSGIVIYMRYINVKFNFNIMW